VLLVLLIIFMVIVPVTPKGLDTLVPQPPKDHKESEPNDRTIVVQVLSNGAGAPSYKINDNAFNKQVVGRMTQIHRIAGSSGSLALRQDDSIDQVSNSP